jgi:hypothetical protein
MPQRFEQPGINQDRNVVWSEAQQPGRFLGYHPRGWQPQRAQKFFAFGVHQIVLIRPHVLTYLHSA